MANPTIIVATPVFGDVFYAPYVQSLLRLQRAASQRQWTIGQLTVSYAHINEARNYLLTRWYDKTKATHLLFVDADMGFEPQLIFDMVAFDKPMTGVVYTKRQVDLKRLAATAKTEPAERAIAQAHDFIIRPVRGRPPRRLGGFIEVEGCGTGIMLIKREAIAAMLKIRPEFSVPVATMTSPLSAGLERMIRVFDNITVDRKLLVNDFAFCHRWRTMCQGELWACADRSVTHVGLHKFGGRFTDAAIQPSITVSRGTPAKLVPVKAASANGKSKSRNGAPKVAAVRIAQPPKAEKAEPDER